MLFLMASMIVLVVLVVVTAFAIRFLYQQLFPIVHWGAPFVPSRLETVDQMIAASQLTADDIVYDLGSGDGRVVLRAVSQSGCRGVGIEIDGRLVRRAKKGADLLKLSDRVEFRHQNFWKADVREATVVFLFQIPHAMPGLERKLFAELSPGTRIVSNSFVFPHVKPTFDDGVVKVYETAKINAL